MIARGYNMPVGGIGTHQYFDKNNNGIQIFDGLCFLTDNSSKFDKLVDGDIACSVAYPNGQYKYALGTVRRFTCTVDAVSTAASDAEMKIMRAPRPN